MGMAFLMKTTYLLPLTIVFLSVAIGALAVGARRRHGFGPLVLGLAASILLLTGKFALESKTAMYASAGLLFAASVWNSWPRRSAKRVSGASTETGDHVGSNESEVGS